MILPMRNILTLVPRDFVVAIDVQFCSLKRFRILDFVFVLVLSPPLTATMTHTVE